MQAEPTRDAVKKPYEAPRLVVFGEIEKLTGMQKSPTHPDDVLVGVPVDGRPYAS